MNYRKATPADREAYCRLWQQVFGDAPAFSGVVFDDFAGVDNIYVAEEDGALAAILSAVPVTLQDRRGAYYYGLATDPAARGKGVMTGLMQAADGDLKARGVQFTCLVPASESLFGFYEQRGYQKAFPLRRLTRSIKRCLWSHAELDSVTARQLAKLREKYAPNSVQHTDTGWIDVLRDLYSGGLTIVSAEDGYGLYFRHGDTLEFIELFAEGDRAAERLLEAARDKTGAEEAVITVGEQQNLFLGEGKRLDYGMIHFLGQPFDVHDSYMRLMMDNEG